jgi:UDP-N-acetyl-D-glucosamine 2-epimerase, UDP-hydrolysing
MDDELELSLIVSGTHLLNEYGYTVREIIEDGFTEYVEINIIDNTSSSISHIMANAIDRFSSYLESNRPDMGIVLGDRYEMLAFAIALGNNKIPIGHLCGGETTEGILDEAYRHSITKFSYLHFANCELHRKRVIQMGESPSRVFNVGDTCIDNIVSTKKMDKDGIENYIGHSLDDKVGIVTFHPVTLTKDSVSQLDNMLSVMSMNDDIFYIITGANADADGNEINKKLKSYCKGHHNCKFFESLGRVRYLSLLKFAYFVIGNSSSGLYEVPFFGIPTVNIGDRQKGRIHGETVIDCGSSEEEIRGAFIKARSAEFRKACKFTNNIFGDGHTAERVVKIIKKQLHEGINIKKSFYDFDFEVE